jgi:hypothetical protein
VEVRAGGVFKRQALQLLPTPNQLVLSNELGDPRLETLVLHAWSTCVVAMLRSAGAKNSRLVRTSFGYAMEMVGAVVAQGEKFRW